VLNPVACDLEREHRGRDAVLLAHQPRLAVDRAFKQRRAVRGVLGDFDPRARDLLAAHDWVNEGEGAPAAVGDRGGVGVEQADQGVDVHGLPCPLERPDHDGLLGRRTRGRPRRADAAAG
jgi:hypothetical protein